jgi:hypothetical protein
MIYEIEPTLLSDEAIAELLHDSEYGKAPEKPKISYREDYIKLLKKGNTFSDENLKLSDKPKEEQAVKVSNDNNGYKIMAYIIVLSIAIGLFIYVKKRYKKMREDDLEKREEGVKFDYFGDLRQKTLMRNILMSSEYLIYMLLFIAIIYSLKRLLKTTDEIF